MKDVAEAEDVVMEESNGGDAVMAERPVEDEEGDVMMSGTRDTEDVVMEEAATDVMAMDVDDKQSSEGGPPQ